MRVFVALFLMWLLAATLCGGRKSWPLACCAPFAILMCWVIWYQMQGWPVTSTPDLGLALFAGVTILGFLSGKLLRKVIFALPALPAKAMIAMRTGTTLLSSLTSKHHPEEGERARRGGAKKTRQAGRGLGAHGQLERGHAVSVRNVLARA
jgi:hypothetical protein